MDTGMVRKIDDLGRIVVPAETRKLFGIREGDQLAISVEGGSIILRKLDTVCAFCTDDEKVQSFKGKGICASCADELTNHS